MGKMGNRKGKTDAHHSVVGRRHFAVCALVEDGGRDEGQHADDDAGTHTC